MIMILILEEADYWNKYFPIGVSEKQTKATLVGFFAAFSRSPCSDIPVLHFYTALFSITSFMISFKKCALWVVEKACFTRANMYKTRRYVFRHLPIVCFES